MVAVITCAWDLKVKIPAAKIHIAESRVKTRVWGCDLHLHIQDVEALITRVGEAI
jgi:hypothetical protein